MGKINCVDIQRAVLGFGKNCLWDPQKVRGAFNTTGVAGWEADIVVIQKSGLLYEVEVKVSVSDFRREFQTKSEKHEALVSGLRRRPFDAPFPTVVSRFYFAMPVEIWQKVKGEVPAWAGVILVDDGKRDKRGRLEPWVEVKAPKLPARKATDKDRAALTESVYFRYWFSAEYDKGTDGANSNA